MTDETTGTEEFGPSWLYIDRVNFPDQRKLKAPTLLPDDSHLRSARATLMIAAPDEHPIILEAFAQLIPVHTGMLAAGSAVEHRWSEDALNGLAIIQLYLERFKRPFPELMAVLSGSRKDAVILQVIAQGKLLEVLRVPVAEAA